MVLRHHPPHLGRGRGAPGAGHIQGFPCHAAKRLTEGDGDFSSDLTPFGTRSWGGLAREVTIPSCIRVQDRYIIVPPLRGIAPKVSTCSLTISKRPQTVNEGFFEFSPRQALAAVTDQISSEGYDTGSERTLATWIRHASRAYGPAFGWETERQKGE